MEWVQAERRGSPLLRAGALHQAIMLAQWLDENALAQALGSESLARYREVGDTHGMAWALCWLGYTTWALSDYAKARAQLQEALILFRQMGDQHGCAHTLVGLTKVATDQGAYASAIAQAEEALALFETLGDKQGMLITQVRLARACYFSGADPARTRSLAEQALALSREVGFKLFSAYALSLLGLLALQRGEETLAQSHLEEALRLQTELWHQHGIAWAMNDLAGLRLAQRDYASARPLYEEGLQRSIVVGDQQQWSLRQGKRKPSPWPCGQHGCGEQQHAYEKPLVRPCLPCPAPPTSTCWLRHEPGCPSSRFARRGLRGAA